MRRCALRVSAALALAVTACLPAVDPGRLQLDGVDRCDYLVKVVSRSPLKLDVHVSCVGRGVQGLRASSPAVAAGLANVRSAQAPLERAGSTFRFGRSLRRASFDYQVDLELLAKRHASIDLALRSGRSLLAPVSTFLMSPLPLDVGTEVHLRVQTPRGLPFSSGLRRSGDHYTLQAHELPVATYSVFGAVERRTLSLGQAGQSTLELAFMDGTLAANADLFEHWVLRSARAVADFYGSFPVPSALIVLAPTPGRSVRFGKLLPESAPGIVLLVGSDAGEADLAADWVLIHELFHLGVPSFHAEGRWFDEGLATYFEPIIRVRAGLLDERTLWRDFARAMPHGAAALSRGGLEHARSFRQIYWGGALYCLLADVQARQTSRGKLGVEDGLRRVLSAGGHASDVWALDRTLTIAEATLPAPILSTLAARHARSAGAVDLEALFQALGVERVGDDVRLRQDAPLAWVRRAIVRPETSTAHPSR